MRIVVAPDKFAGSMTAAEAAAAFERGWLSVAPGDDVVRIPLSDGGPGFIDCLAEALGGEVRRLEVSGPWGHPVTASVLVVADTWYVEAAQANGRDLPGTPEPMAGTSAGVGEILLAALGEGASEIVVGLGGSATNDGGAGLLAALGARATTASGQELDLRAGPMAIGGIAHIDLSRPRRLLRGVRLTAASDVDNPLLGHAGATAVFGPQKGLGTEDLPLAEESLARLVRVCDAAGAPVGVDRLPGAGAAGGLGYALMALGGVRISGVEFVAGAVGLARSCRGAHLVVTGEGTLDTQSLRGKVVMGVREAAGDVPVAVVAGRNRLAPRQWRGAGITTVLALEDRASSPAQSMAAAAELMELAAADLATSVRESAPTRP